MLGRTQPTAAQSPAQASGGRSAAQSTRPRWCGLAPRPLLGRAPAMRCRRRGTAARRCHSTRRTRRTLGASVLCRNRYRTSTRPRWAACSVGRSKGSSFFSPTRRSQALAPIRRSTPRGLLLMVVQPRGICPGWRDSCEGLVRRNTRYWWRRTANRRRGMLPDGLRPSLAFRPVPVPSTGPPNEGQLGALFTRSQCARRMAHQPRGSR